MSKTIGIDLGTTNSVVSIMEAGEPKVIVNSEGGRVTASEAQSPIGEDPFDVDDMSHDLLKSPFVRSIPVVGLRCWDSCEEVESRIHLSPED